MEARANHDPGIDRGQLREHVRSTLTRLSRTGELPALPPAACAALAIARNPDAGVDDISRVIRTDVGLSARILRVANSAAYARRVPARALPDAVLTLGLRKTCDVLVAAGARQLFRQVPRQAEALWNHALATAIIAEELARHTNVVASHLAFLPGLFHDVGRIGFLLAADEAYTIVHDRLNAGAAARPDAERGWYGFDHAEAGAILTEDWGLGPDQVEAIRWHHQPAQAEAGRHLAAVLNVADVGAYALGFGGGATPPSDAEGRTCLGLSLETAADVLARARLVFEQHRDLIG